MVVLGYGYVEFSNLYSECNGRNAHCVKLASPAPLNPAVTKLGLKELERKAERLHQLPTLITNSAVDLNAEAISKLSMFLHVLLNRWVRDVGAKRLIVGVNLGPHKSQGIVWVLIKGVVNHARLSRLNSFVGDAGKLQILVNTTWLDVHSRQQHEGCGLVEAGHWFSCGT